MNVGVVAIGRNEGDRLRACLASAGRDCPVVVYVDSGSSDGSVRVAESLGASVVQLDLSIAFTAARARNEGFARLREIAPDIRFVQFIDGDCEIVEGWAAKAEAAISADPKIAIVCGRRRERFPQATIYNKLCDMEWATPVGIARACGGDALIRVGAFTEVGGYDPTVIAGEEPEMCVRLRARGWEIHRIDAEMTLHDAAITTIHQWWKRSIRSGHAYAQGNAMHGDPPEYFATREVRSITFWGDRADLSNSFGDCAHSFDYRTQMVLAGFCPIALVSRSGDEDFDVSKGDGGWDDRCHVVWHFHGDGKIPPASWHPAIPAGTPSRATEYNHRI